MKLVQSQKQDSTQTFMVEGDLALVTSKVNEYFTNNGYKLEAGSPDNGVYGVGNDVMRILFGAFVKRYKFNILVRQNQNLIQVDLSKAMTGIAGGAIGFVKLNQEYDKCVIDLTNIFNQA